MKQVNPPNLADRFLEWYCSPFYLEEVQGDLHEAFHHRVKTKGLNKARLIYWMDVIRYFKPFRLKAFQQLINHGTFLTMKNIIKITLRNFKKDKLSGLVRLGNLILGIGTFLLAYNYTKYETNYDQFHEKKEVLYRLGQLIDGNPWAASPIGAGAFALDNISGIRSMARFTRFGKTAIKKDKETVFYESGILGTDSLALTMLSFDVILGNAESALSVDDGIILTESMAKKYFGDDNPMGQRLEISNDRQEFRVVRAVIKDVPKQSHLQFDFLCSNTGWKEFRETWRNFFVYTYFELYPNSDITTINELLKNEYLKQYEVEEGVEIFLTPITNIHLKTNHEKEMADNGNVYYVYILLSIGIFVLLISCINFVNLSVIKGLDRAKEVGLRKTVGASRLQLVVQFLSENFVFLSVAGIICATGLVLLEPYLQQFSGVPFPSSFVTDPSILVPLTIILIGLEVVCGVYPAMVLSKFRPADVIKSGGHASLPLKQISGLRRTLIIMQFTLSTVLVVGSVVVFQQLNHIQSQDLGFEKDQVLTFRYGSEIHGKLETFKTELLKLNGVKSFSTSSSVPGYRIMLEGMQELGVEESYATRLLLADEGLIETFQMRLDKGENFRTGLPENKHQFILNEKAASLIFQDRNPIGKKMSWGNDTGRVVGTVKNFNFQTLHNEVEPLTILYRADDDWGYAALKFEAASVLDLLDQIRQVSVEVYPELPPIQLEFLDARFEQLYLAETNLKSIVLAFCIISILLTASGVYGIATYDAQRRSKEIAIRKVLGSSLIQLLQRLSKSFIALLIISLMIGIPGAYMITDWWLADFAYQVSLSAFTFIWAMIAMLGLVLASSGIVTIKAASSNPAEVLKNE